MSDNSSDPLGCDTASERSNNIYETPNGSETFRFHEEETRSNNSGTVKVKQVRRGRKQRHAQTLQERYGGNVVNPIVTDQYTSKSHKKTRQALKNDLTEILCELAQKCSDGPTISNLSDLEFCFIDDAEIAFEPMSDKQATDSFIQYCKKIRKTISAWLLPSLKKATVRVCPEVMKIWHIASTAEILIQTAHQKKKLDRTISYGHVF